MECWTRLPQESPALLPEEDSQQSSVCSPAGRSAPSCSGRHCREEAERTNVSPGFSPGEDKDIWGGLEEPCFSAWGGSYRCFVGWWSGGKKAHHVFKLFLQNLPHQEHHDVIKRPLKIAHTTDTIQSFYCRVWSGCVRPYFGNVGCLSYHLRYHLQTCLSVCLSIYSTVQKS